MSKRFHVSQNTAGQALTELMLETFRLNGALLAAGDRLVAPIGLTSARWQVLGAIAIAGRAQPVAHIARDMGLTRQSVQRVVDNLAAEGLVSFEPNPHHRRAKLIALTDSGRRAYEAAIERHAGWSNRLAKGFKPNAFEAAARVMRELRTRLLFDSKAEED